MHGYDFEELTISDENQPNLAAWLIKAQLKEGEQKRGLVLQLHGNAENMSTHFHSVVWLTKFGFDVLTLDYRGYGSSQGKESVVGAIADAGRAIAYVQHNLQPQKLILYGQSIGGAFAGYVATQPEHKKVLAGVIIESAFSSYRSIVRDKLQDAWLFYPVAYPLSWLFSDYYAPYKYATEISPVPVLYLASPADNIVPYYHSELLYGTAGQPKYFYATQVPGHISAVADAGSRAKILEFIKSLPVK